MESAQALLQQGNVLFGRGECSAAAEKYEAALESLDAGHAELRIRCGGNLAACALKEGDAEKALTHCESVLRLEPHHSKNRFRRALALMRRPQLQVGKAKRAQELLQAQADLDFARREAPQDKAVQAAEEELLSVAKASAVKLKPPSWLFPEGSRDFEYHHGRSAEAVTAGPTPQIELHESCNSIDGGGGPGLERNLMIFLHGFGGCKDPFSQLGENLSLPKTATLVLNGPEALPEELLDNPPGYSWFDMLDEETMDFIKPTRKELRRLRSMEECCAMLAQALQGIVTCGWSLHEVFLFGYGQGGSVALELLLQMPLGGAVTVASEVLPERLHGQKAPSRTAPGVEGPEVLLINGARDRQTSVQAAEASARWLREVLGNDAVKLCIFSDRGGEMLRGSHAEESKCLMEFLSDRLWGVGRRGSAEAMEKLGAERVAFAEQMPPGSEILPEVEENVMKADFLSELD